MLEQMDMDMVKLDSDKDIELMPQDVTPPASPYLEAAQVPSD